MSESKDDRSSAVKAYAMVAQVTTVAGTMVVPGLLGLGVDQFLKTGAVFTIVGFGLGLILGIWQIVHLGPLE